ncbi:MAG: hypothetical protein GX221_06050 [Candidatus Riflebacteria bacterium]|nr:hypothetical protein [Candidatus Riflebacteria bacterium]
MKLLCPLCMKEREYLIPEEKYLKYKNTERLICRICEDEIAQNTRQAWQVVSSRVFPKRTLGY